MKTRIIKTDIYTDETMLGITPDMRFICVYLYTNSHIGLTNIYKIPIQLIQLETGYDLSVIRTVLDKLTELKVVEHYNHLWVKLLRDDFGALEYSGGKNDIAKENYIASIPLDVMDFFNHDTSIVGSIHTTYKSEIINQKSEISDLDSFAKNQKQQATKKSANKKDNLEGLKLVEVYAKHLGLTFTPAELKRFQSRNIKPAKTLLANYKLPDIKKAFQYCQDTYEQWTLETVENVILKKLYD